MKVYVFATSQTIECEVSDTTIKVFAKREDAIAELKKWRDDEMTYACANEWEISIDAPDHFQAYLYGFYCENHSEFSVTELEVL